MMTSTQTTPWFIPGVLAFASLLLLGSQALAKEATPPLYQTITFPAADKLSITADLYLSHADKQTPFIVLCHQARSSRGEYREIAPRLNTLGFNCLAIDQRSGNKNNGVKNKTAAQAKNQQRPTRYVDAMPDLAAAVAYARKNYAAGSLILWGSSYSAGLALHYAGTRPTAINGVIAFSPGEYFTGQGKPANWVQIAAQKISVPAYITSAKKEKESWAAIYKMIPGKQKTGFLPETTGTHGARALWRSRPDSAAYWQSLTKFLQTYYPVAKAKPQIKK